MKAPKYQPPPQRTITKTLEGILKLLSIPAEHRHIGWTASDCPRCSAPLYAIRHSTSDEPLMTFCRECNFFALNWESRFLSYRWSQEVEQTLARTVTPGPLFRDINKFLRSLRPDRR